MLRPYKTLPPPEPPPHTHTVIPEGFFRESSFCFSLLLLQLYLMLYIRCHILYIYFTYTTFPTLLM